MKSEYSIINIFCRLVCILFRCPVLRMLECGMQRSTSSYSSSAQRTEVLLQHDLLRFFATRGLLWKESTVFHPEMLGIFWGFRVRWEVVARVDDRSLGIFLAPMPPYSHKYFFFHWNNFDHTTDNNHILTNTCPIMLMQVYVAFSSVCNAHDIMMPSVACMCGLFRRFAQRADASQVYCKSARCIFETDKDTCCENAMSQCSTFDCSRYGFTQDTENSAKYCKAQPCQFRLDSEVKVAVGARFAFETNITRLCAKDAITSSVNVWALFVFSHYWRIAFIWRWTLGSILSLKIKSIYFVSFSITLYRYWSSVNWGLLQQICCV